MTGPQQPLPVLGKCSVCKTEVMLRLDGVVRVHHRRWLDPPAVREPGYYRCGPFAYGASMCAGSGRPPLEV